MMMQVFLKRKVWPEEHLQEHTLYTSNKQNTHKHRIIRMTSGITCVLWLSLLILSILQ